MNAQICFLSQTENTNCIAELLPGPQPQPEFKIWAKETYMNTHQITKKN